MASYDRDTKASTSARHGHEGLAAPRPVRMRHNSVDILEDQVALGIPTSSSRQSLSSSRRREREPTPSASDRDNIPTRRVSSASTSSHSTLKAPKSNSGSRVVSSGSHLGRQSKEGSFQTFSGAWSSASNSKQPRTSRTMQPPPGKAESVSESGGSVLSAFPMGDASRRRQDKVDAQKRASRKQTDSPLRRWAKWMGKSGKSRWSLAVVVGCILCVKWAVGLGSYSGEGMPPLRGDFEAQRHWISLTSSSLDSLNVPFLYVSSSTPPPSVPSSQWYYHDLSYWGLDYPPLTAYHSFFLGFLARLFPHTAAFVALRPPTTSKPATLLAWEENMSRMELQGDMKSWMRSTVIGGDLLLWISAVVVYCRANLGNAKGEKGRQTVTVAVFTILLQPALILIDSGHFQYNSIMLGLTLWSINLFQTGYDLLGAVSFVLSLGFKQMALYYSPAIFAYLLGKCFYLGGRRGVSLLINLGFVTLSSFAILFLPVLNPPSNLLQAIHRIFPFARGLFEDKVANVWCAINVVVKLRDLAGVATLAKVALLATLIAILPGVIGYIWVSYEAGKRSRASENGVRVESDAVPTTTPTLILLPHALLASSLAFFLFSFQVHEKSILLPLMPLTVLMGGREAGFGRMDWEWAVLLNNIGVFSMWPLLKRDHLGLQYAVLVLGWNYVIGYNPVHLRASFVKYLSLSAYLAVVAIHFIELVASPPAHLPDLFVVLNLTLSTGVFGIGFLWATKRSAQEGWAVVGMSIGH